MFAVNSSTDRSISFVVRNANDQPTLRTISERESGVFFGKCD